MLQLIFSFIARQLCYLPCFAETQHIINLLLVRWDACIGGGQCITHASWLLQPHTPDNFYVQCIYGSRHFSIVNKYIKCYALRACSLATTNAKDDLLLEVAYLDFTR